MSSKYLMTAACALLSLGTARNIARSLQVQTANGDITGTINATSPDVRQFLGIPHAEAPTSSLRFQPPVKYTSQGSINATAFAPSCLQPVSTGNATDVYSLYLPKLHLGSDLQSEDCLYLNVYAPLTPAEDKLPVFVWIHGGGFTTNGANVRYQPGTHSCYNQVSHFLLLITGTFKCAPTKSSQLST
jgi:cholinesterase